MLEFHVTNEIYDLYKRNQKHHEYRDFSDYWISRLSKVNEPTNAMIVRGYTKDKIPVLIEDVAIIPRDSIDVPAYRDFIKTMHCYDITLKLNLQSKSKGSE